MGYEMKLTSGSKRLRERSERRGRLFRRRRKNYKRS
jgi:hypothetical protein